MTEPAYTLADPQSGRTLVNYHLRELGIGETQFVRIGDDGLRYGRSEKPADIGVCRAYVLTEAAWPQGAELCVIVDWSPDAALRRDAATGKVPAGAEDHWRERITATAQALESLGYVVEPSRFRCSPRFHFTAELLVYRMTSGVLPRRAPADSDWALTKPVPPHYQRHGWTWQEQAPEDLVRDALGEAGLHPNRQDQRSPHGQVGVRRITQTVWPPEADRCALVTWWPAVGAENHWTEIHEHLQRVLGQAGLVVRSRARPWNPEEETAEFLVYRVASSP
ncbi:hypothetical protein OG322_22755 [Streptomyces sp. NBC_01260]|uniref:hypothetical protein n=1 Tax=unclassified Streptomyces TaxID=2593676 RepID=UPI00288B083F|nr:MULTISPECIES: hypothetical protein [unclassified Streptomyces]WNI31514.1 hypothetical protein RLT59_24005 [Streptomyces sp. ITFR-6]